jgi:hypothetical protein
MLQKMEEIASRVPAVDNRRQSTEIVAEERAQAQSAEIRPPAPRFDTPTEKGHPIWDQIIKIMMEYCGGEYCNSKEVSGKDKVRRIDIFARNLQTVMHLHPEKFAVFGWREPFQIHKKWYKHLWEKCNNRMTCIARPKQASLLCACIVIIQVIREKEEKSTGQLCFCLPVRKVTVTPSHVIRQVPCVNSINDSIE